MSADPGAVLERGVFKEESKKGATKKAAAKKASESKKTQSPSKPAAKTVKKSKK